MTTTTAKRAASPAPAPVIHTPTIWELEIGDSGRTLLENLADARQTRLAGERQEKPLKTALKAIYEPECDDLEQGDVLQLLASGELMGTVSRVEGNFQCDWDLLMSAFPEAFEQCVSKPTHLRFNPA